MKVHDASNERKTTDNLLRVLKDVVGEVQAEWGANVVAIVTDASGESRKARRLYGREEPSMVVLDCYAHQVFDIIYDAYTSVQLTVYKDQFNCRRLLQIRR